MSRVTIKSIAKDLGISHMTVSRALSDNPNVLKQTREAVQKRARELGYVKSAAAVAMRGDRARIVGLLLPNIVNEFYARFANAMALACDRESLQLIIHLTNDDLATEEQALASLQEIQALSVVRVPAPGQVEEVSPNQNRMHVIELIRQPDGLQTNAAILVDDTPAIVAAVTHLAKAGHTRIAFIGGSTSLSSGRSRLAAFMAGAKGAGLEIPENLVRVGTPTFEMGRKNAHEILTANSATALLCGGFEISNGALSAVMAQTPNPAPDFAFIGYGDPSFYEWVRGGITTVRVPVERLAERAVALCSLGEKPDKSLTTSYPADLKAR